MVHPQGFGRNSPIVATYLQYDPKWECPRVTSLHYLFALIICCFVNWLHQCNLNTLKDWAFFIHILPTDPMCKGNEQGRLHGNEHFFVTFWINRMSESTGFETTKPLKQFSCEFFYVDLFLIHANSFRLHSHFVAFLVQTCPRRENVNEVNVFVCDWWLTKSRGCICLLKSAKKCFTLENLPPNPKPKVCSIIFGPIFQ